MPKTFLVTGSLGSRYLSFRAAETAVAEPARPAADAAKPDTVVYSVNTKIGRGTEPRVPEETSPTV